ncbi:hypothetical protein PybrP1_005890 [[Pythium] brassicae (nom. inval.)]|nr:hypothetical protein PybrP1_005890 [[Pythium] brassicae (nom. inval.)]
MATAAAAAHNRWTALDDALESSDQSFAGLRRVSSVGVARRKRPPLASAFFFETTDEEEAGGASSSGRVAERALVAASLAQPLPPRLHIGEVRFPATRSVLCVSVEQVLPRVSVPAAAMKQVYQLFRDRLRARGADDSDVLCYLCGDAASVTHSKRVALSRVERKQQQRKDKWDANVLWVPVYAIEGERRALQLSQASYAASIASAQQAYGDDKTDAPAAKLQPALLVASSAVHSAQLDVQLECPAPSLLFTLRLVRSLPLLMTPLAASLSRQEFGAGDAVRRSGYLTLDRARKAVPVLRTDPLVVQQPIVGVWVYGVPLSDEWSGDGRLSAQFADPYLYFACVGFVASSAIKERVEVSANTFLVALYPSRSASPGHQQQQHVSALPRFFECSYAALADARDQRVPMQLFAQHTSCLVGVSSFSKDVEFTMRASSCDAWETARQELGVPTALAACRTDDDTASHDDEELGERLSSSASDASFRASLPPTTARRPLSRVTFRSTPSAVANDTSSASSAQRKRPSVSTRVAHEPEKIKENEHPNTRSSHAEHNSTSSQLLHIENADFHGADCPPPATPSPKRGELHDPDSEPSESTPLGARSCCKSQALLTIQHQQILENQQRQLHEMQEQIAHLRRLLDATKRMNAVDHRDEFSSSRVSMPESLPPLEDVTTLDPAESHDKDDEALRAPTPATDEAPARSPLVSGRRTADDTQVESVFEGEQNGADEADSDREETSEREDVLSDGESSLHLSSLSSASMRSEMSSLSSSLVGTRLKERFRTSGSGIRLLEQRAVGSSSAVADVVSSFQTRMAEDTSRRQSEQEHFAAAGHSNTPIGQERAEHKSRLSDEEKNDNDDDDDDDDDGAEGTRFPSPLVEKLMPPDHYLRQRGPFVDNHGGCFTVPTTDLHSFCVPRIKFSTPASSAARGGYLSDSDDDEEFRRIEQKYKRLVRS